MIDMVPKAISLTLVNHSKENLQRELLQELYKPDVLEDLLKESELVVARRKEVVGMVQALNKAEECVLCNVRIGHHLTPRVLQDCGGCLRSGHRFDLWSLCPVFSTYFIFTPCLTASTLIIPVLDLDVLFPFPLCLSRDMASDRHSSFDATVSESGVFEVLISVLADLKWLWMIENVADAIGIQYAFANSALRTVVCAFQCVAFASAVVMQMPQSQCERYFYFAHFTGPLFLFPIPTIRSNFTGWFLSSTSRLLWRQSRLSGRCT